MPIGTVAAEGKDVRRVLIITGDHEENITTTETGVKVGRFIRLTADQVKGADSGVVTGQVTAVKGKQLTVRRGRPYLISTGTQLQRANRALTQRGDLIASLIFERQKTGDIVQGLPRVEELLEGRKPKEHAVIAPHEGKIEIEYYSITDLERIIRTITANQPQA